MIQATQNALRRAYRQFKIQGYLRRGALPFSDGYMQYRDQRLAEQLEDAALLADFRNGGALPVGFGQRLDERLVEYPWVYAHLLESGGKLLDAGSTLNRAVLLNSPKLRAKHSNYPEGS
jgi:hypothetical protein